MNNTLLYFVTQELPDGSVTGMPGASAAIDNKSLLPHDLRAIKMEKSIAGSCSFVNLLFRYITGKVYFDLLSNYTAKSQNKNY